MAGNTVNLNLKLSAEGITAIAKLAQEINANLTGAATAAGKIGSGAPKTMAVARSGAASTQENVNYGVQRSIGGTGSASRDFAQQAQGLGGLVHLYATFAANLYAADTAYRALSDAVNTAHLVQGLDQLGAASGKALGTLASRLNDATGGALSLKDSLTSVANASAIGLSSAQILKMGEVAKKASQALGWDMPDALDRLTKGIGKNRPQLLDELGILVNVNTVYKDYAISVGKSVSALSDFEKKQAFANAVLKQGIDKFGEINIDTNPYVKIEASLSNLTQSGLTLVNTVLSPLVKLLSESPAALSAVMAGISTILIKQAIPAIGAFRENAKAAAAEAGQLANVRSIAAFDASGKAHVAAGVATLAAAKKAAEDAADAEIAIMDAAEKKMAAIKINGAISTSRRIKEILAKNPTDVTMQDQQSLDRIANKLQKTDAEGATAIREYEEAVVHYNIANEKSIGIKSQITEKTKELNAEVAKGNALSNIGLQQQIIADRANRDAAFANMSNLVAEKTQTEGYLAARKAGYAEIAKIQSGLATVPVFDKEGKDTGTTRAVKGVSELSSIAEKAGAKLQGVGKIISLEFTAATGAISTAMNAFQPWLAVIGLVIAAAEALNAWLTTNSVQMDEFNKSVDASTAALKLADDTLAHISKNAPTGFDAPAIQARANAFGEVADSIDKMNDAFRAIGPASSGWDKFWDTFTLRGSGSTSFNNFADSTSAALVKSISLIEEEGPRKAFTDKLAKIYNVKVVNTENLAKAAKEAGVIFGDTMIAAGQEAAKDQSKLTQSSASLLTEAMTGFDTLNKSYEKLTTSLENKSPLREFANGLIDESDRMTKAFKNPIEGLSELAAIANKESSRQFFTPASQKQLSDLSYSLKQVKEGITAANAAIKAGEEANAKGPINLDNPSAKDLDRQNTIDAGDRARATLKNLEPEAARLSKSLEHVLDEPFKRGVGLISQPLTDAIEKGGLAVMSSLAGGLAGPGSADAQMVLKNKEIDVQERGIKAMYDLKESIEIQGKEEELKRLKPGSKEYDALSVELGFLRLGLKGNADALMALPKEFRAASAKRMETNVDVSAALAPLDSQRQINVAQAARSEAVLRDAEIQKEKQGRLDILAIETKSLELAYTSGGLESDALFKAKQAAEERLASGREELAMAAAVAKAKQEGDVVDKLQSIKGTPTKVITDAQTSKDAADAAVARLKASQSAEDEARATAQVVEGLTRQEAIQEKTIAYDQQRAQLATEYNTAVLNAGKADLANLNSIGAVTQEYAAIRTAELDAEIQKQIMVGQISAAEAAAEVERDKLKLSFIIRTAEIEADTHLSAGEKAQLELEAAQKYTEELQKSNDTLADKEKIIATNNIAAQKAIDLTKEHGVEAAKLNAITSDLGGIFGDLGTKIGGLISSFAQVAEANKAAADHAKEMQAISDKTNVKADIDNTAAAQKNSVQVALQGDAKLLASTKNLFGQKTMAYKALNATEKVVHVASLAMDAAKNASTLAQLPGKIADGVAELFSQGGWIGFAGAAAFLGLMAALGFGGKGSSVAPPKGYTAEERQKVQGTGTTYDQKTGKIVETGGGVLGDPTAKMDSIVKSLDSISSSSVQGITLSNQMVTLLSSINDGINKAAAQLVNIPGLRTGSAFGTPAEGLSSSTNTTLLNPIKHLEAGITASLSSLKNFNINSVFLPLANMMQMLPGSKSSTSVNIADSGLKIAGTLADLAKGTAGTIKQFENDIVTTKSSAVFGLIKKTSTKDVTQTQDLNKTESGQKVQDFFTQVFSSSVSLLEELGKTFGKTKDSIDATLATIPVSAVASLKGLTGDDFTKALSGLVSDVLDKASKALFGSLISTYQKIGETSLETLVRISDDNTKVNAALQSMGEKTANQMVTSIMAVGTSSQAIAEASIAVTEALVTGAGGLDKFLSQSSNFNKNFLTDAERLAPVQKAVTDGLAELGYTGIDTRDKFKDLVLGLDLTTAKGQKTYQSLMDMSDAFAQVYASTTKSLSAEDLRVKQLNNDIALQKALGNVYKATLMTRQEELYQLSLYPAAQADVLIAQQKQLYALQDATAMYNQQVQILKAEGKATESVALQRQLELQAMDDRLRPSQIYINALNDEADIVTRLTKARDTEASTLNATIDSIKGYITNLKAYKTTLSSGSSSILTEQEKYKQAKDNLAKLQATAIGTATTPDQIAAQKAALDGLSGAADSFLQTSQTMYASSDQYAADYKSVMDILDSTTAVLGVQESDSQKQLDQLTASTSFLDTIATATETTASILTEYYAQQGVVSAAQANVPNALDTNTVASNLQNIAGNANITTTTSGLTDTINALTAQIADLQSEVAGLRADQNAQTGDLLNATVSTGNTVANAVATAGKTQLTDSNWSNRNRPMLA